MRTEIEYHLPVRPFSPIDALNRAAVAQGSIERAVAGAYADYNGHHVTVSWNDYRQYYVASYTWAGQVVLARGSAEECVSAATREYNRGALGASVAVSFRNEDDAQRVTAMFPELLSGHCLFGHQCDWYTWRHACASRAGQRGAKMVFDWDLMQVTENEEAYLAALKAKHGRAYLY